jgi:HK97 gp10 family phage protein
MALKKTKLERFRRGISAAVDRGVETAAGYVADLERQLAPYDADADHKHLNESIEVQGQKGSRKRKVVAGVGLPDARAIHNEYGTEHMGAAPFAGPAAAAIDVGLEVRKEIEKLARGGA